MADDALYDQVAAEIQQQRIDPGLWTKAFAEANGDIERAKAIYIRYRVAKLADIGDTPESKSESPMGNAVYVTFFMLLMVGLVILSPLLVWGAFQTPGLELWLRSFFLMLGISAARFSYRIYKKLKAG